MISLERRNFDCGVVVRDLSRNIVEFARLRISINVQVLFEHSFLRYFLFEHRNSIRRANNTNRHDTYVKIYVYVIQRQRRHGTILTCIVMRFNPNSDCVYNFKCRTFPAI